MEVLVASRHYPPVAVETHSQQASASVESMDTRSIGSQSKLQRVRNDYLDLMQACLTGSIVRDFSQAPFGSNVFDSRCREHGLDWPSRAHTMIGTKRLANLRALTESVIADNVPGDLIETGVWRGGACILMRAVLFAYNVSDRSVWVVDSFEGLPVPSELRYPADAGSDFHTYEQLAVSLDEVQENFRAYGLLDEQVTFLKGWFKNTLPNASIGQLALMRLDGDMYESTMDALTNLYPKLSPQGYAIIDDYHAVPACKAAVSDYCVQAGISPEIIEIDGVGVYWRKSAGPSRHVEVVRQNDAVASQEMQIAHLNQALAELSGNVIIRLNQSLADRDDSISAFSRQIASLNQVLAERDERISALLSSTSWKITKPLRAVGSLLKRRQVSSRITLKENVEGKK